jgi:hypothetical protein
MYPPPSAVPSHSDSAPATWPEAGSALADFGGAASCLYFACSVKVGDSVSCQNGGWLQATMEIVFSSSPSVPLWNDTRTCSSSTISSRSTTSECPAGCPLCAHSSFLLGCQSTGFIIFVGISSVWSS